MKWLIGIALVLVGLYAAVQIAYPTYTHRYRLTIEIEADGEVFSGSSIVEVNAWSQPKFLPEAATLLHRAYGEAVFVDLGQGANAVALLAVGGPRTYSGSAMSFLAIRVFQAPTGIHPLDPFIAMQGIQGRRLLPLALTPAIITFSDPQNPRTARWVPIDQLEKAYGRRTHFRSAFIELPAEGGTPNDAPPLVERIKWLNDESACRQFWSALITSGLRFDGSLACRDLLLRGN